MKFRHEYNIKDLEYKFYLVEEGEEDRLIARGAREVPDPGDTGFTYEMYLIPVDGNETIYFFFEEPTVIVSHALCSRSDILDKRGRRTGKYHGCRIQTIATFYDGLEDGVMKELLEYCRVNGTDLW